MLSLLVCVTAAAAPPRVLVIRTWAEVRGKGGESKWSGRVLAPLTCTTADAGLSEGPNCLSGVPAAASVTMLDGSTTRALGKKNAIVDDGYGCARGDDGCQVQPLWLLPPAKSQPKQATASADELDDETTPLTLAELKAPIGFWPRDVPTFAVVEGARGVPLPKELEPLPRPITKRPDFPGLDAPLSTGDLVSFSMPKQAEPFKLLMVGDAFAYKPPGAAGFVWGGRRASQHLELLGVLDLDGNGHPEVVFGLQHPPDTMFTVIELGPEPRGVGGHGGLTY